MLDLNKHIKTILDACVQHTEYPHVINVGEKEVVVKIERKSNDETIAVDRFIAIEAEVDDRFWVRVEEIARDPVFTTMKTCQQFRARHKEDLDWAQRYVYAHIKSAVKPSMIPPKALVEKMEEINSRWLTEDDYQLILKLDGCEYGDSWRYRYVCQKTGHVAVENINVDEVTGIMMSTLRYAIKQAKREGFIAGVAHVSQHQARQTFQAAFNTAGIANHEIPGTLTDYMRGKIPFPE